MLRKAIDLIPSAYARAVERFIAEPLVRTRPDRLIHAAQAIIQPSTESWGGLPVLSLVSACGLLLIAVGNTGSLAGSRYAELWFWAGLLVLLMPTATRLISTEAARRERIGLVVLLGLALYLVKVMHSPFAFTFADELVHLYNVNAILQNQRLFTENPILPVTALYPGLGSVTAALSALSGLPTFYTGLLVVGMARLVLVLAIFLFTEQISRSARVAAVATVLYMGHSNFLYWSVQFSYESLSFPLILVVLFVAARRASSDSDDYTGLTLLALLGIGTVVVTHHLSSYFLTVFLILWTFVYFQFHLLFLGTALGLIRWYAGEIHNRQLVRTLQIHWVLWWKVLRRQASTDAKRGPQRLALFALVAALVWLIFVANLTISYLSPVFSQALLSIARMIAGEESGRQLFVSSSGYVAPLWERLTGIGSVLLCLVGLPFGLLQVWRLHRDSPLALLSAGAAIAYFGILGLRFTPASWETGNRASAYLFVGLSFILGLGLVEFWLSQRVPWVGRLIFSSYLAVIFMGGVIAGWPPQLRQTQPYLVDIGGQTMVPQGLAVAEWARTVLGPDHIMAADATNGRLLMVYGQQHSLVGKHPDVNILLKKPELDTSQIQDIQTWNIEYAVVDRRRISWNSMAGYYFDRLEGGAIPSIELFEPEVYEKFYREKNVNKVLDSGNIVIYELGALRDSASIR